MPASRVHRSLWLRRGVPATLIVSAALVLMSSFGLLPSGGLADRTPAVARPQAQPPVPPHAQAQARVAAPTVAATIAHAPVQPTKVAGRWQYPDSTSAVWGRTGPLLRFRVAVEQGLPVSVAEFTGVVDDTLSDQRSWIAGNDLRLQRVAVDGRYDFTIWLATPDTAYRMCLTGGIDIREDGVPYTSCRAGDNVIINAARYLGGVPDYGAPLADYRHYVVNHEVGHRLGNGHVLCPGPGRPAPVMQQQTLGLQGCVANSWPYINGQRYTGPETD